MIRVTVELTPEQAAALMRFADKSGHHEAMAVLYPHRPAELRAEQAAQICSALMRVYEALAAADVRSWPWIETGAA